MEFNLPEKCGVYIFKDSSGRPLYVGKALNIKKRVKSHFALKGALAKESNLLGNTARVEPIVVDSEIEALVLEANLIKRLQPPFNSQLKDDKDYLYIKITSDSYPKVLTARKKDLAAALVYFGPFPSASKVRETLRTLRKIFPYSTCKPNQGRACLHYHLGLCPGVCLGKISEKNYRKNIKALILFLEGNKSKVTENLDREVKKHAKNLEFEEAAAFQRRLDALSYITRPTRPFQEYLDEDLATLRDRELTDLASNFGLAQKPARIEGFDISNIGGRESVGSMVVFNEGDADRGEYRRFKIKRMSGANDPAMMAEVIDRRFNHNWKRPNLIVVDGGKGQLSAAHSVVARRSLNIPVAALAKRLEEIYLPDREKPLRLPRQSDALKLVQRIRDEAHRFAIAYHRHLRNKATFD